jgi:hypothetical protein
MSASPLCSCGSGLYSECVFAARGIYLCRACDRCRSEKLDRFRPEVLDDPDYECIEDIEPDPGTLDEDW